MAKVRGTTTSPGKTTTRKAASVVADDISRPHGKGNVKQVGSQGPGEAQALSGDAGARGSGSVREIGPSVIQRPSGPTGTVKRAGAANWEDTVVVEGVNRPYSRQTGSVRQVGPASRDYARILEGSGSAGTAKSGRVTRSNKIFHDTPLLVSGVGRKHPQAVFAGQPGSFKGRQAVRIAGGAGESVRVDGRRGRFGAQPQGDEQMTPEGPTIVPGDTRSSLLPAFRTLEAVDITDTTATLSAEVNPNELATTYYFEYGLDDTYGDSIPVGEDGDAGDTDGYGSVSEDLTGLDPDTEYHFRLVIENSTGVVESDDQFFTTDA